MHTHVVALILAAISWYSSSALPKPPSPTPVPAGVVFASDRDNGRTVVVRVKEGLEIRLTSNPTTGYSWKAAPLNTGALAERGKPEYVAPNYGIVGATGSEVFRYAAIVPGTEHLHFAYARPWEKTAPARVFALTVTVRS